LCNGNIKEKKIGSCRFRSTVRRFFGAGESMGKEGKKKDYYYLLV
jgi:hypothetical protein